MHIAHQKSNATLSPSQKSTYDTFEVQYIVLSVEEDHELNVDLSKDHFLELRAIGTYRRFAPYS
jgi:hypothetical protein